MYKLSIMRIGVCIPCHKGYIQYIQKCLESIEYQTRKPDVVSISFSEVEEAPELFTYSFPIEVSISNEKQCQGKNRNIASSKIDVDILTFFDADDIMHPKRLECIESAFQNDIDGFLHSNKPCASSQYRMRLLSQNLWETIENNLYKDGFSSTKDSICGRVESSYGTSTNGHFSCKQSLWREIPFPEEYGIGEDSEYVYRIYEKEYKLGYSPDKLSYYIRDDFPVDSSLDILDSYKQYTSRIRPPVFCNYSNTEINNVVDFLLSEKSPERKYPIFIIESVQHLPENPVKKIIYNIEQMTREDKYILNSSRMNQHDIVEIWDYSITNYNILKNYGFIVKCVPFKLNLDKILEYRNLQTLTKEYDIAFCGQIGPYRQYILDELNNRGKKVLILDGDYTMNRDIEIGKSKLLLNIHFNETYKVFETIRCEPWLASGHTVLTESSLDNDSRAISVPYNELVDKACEIIDSMETNILVSNNKIIFYCPSLEMRNPRHYDTYDVDRDVYIYNMALQCKNKGYIVIIYAHSIINEYNGIIFRNPNTFDPSLQMYICILFPPFEHTIINSIVNVHSIFMCIDQNIDIKEYKIERISKIFFESMYIRNKYSYIPDNKCELLYNSLYPINESIERTPFKILCTQPYDEELFNLIYSFWPFIKNNIPGAEFMLVSDSSVVPKDYREFINDIIVQPGIIERGLISKEELQYEKKTSLIHLNMSSTPESYESINESIELGCIPILSNIYKRKIGIHISELTNSQKGIQKLINIFVSLVNSEVNINEEYINLVRRRTTTYTDDHLIDKIENHLNPSSSLRSEK